jgi:ribosomal-protein-alanine N-acetyltransferase
VTDIAIRSMHWSDIPVAAAFERDLFPHDPWTPEQFWSELAGVPATRWYVVAVDGSEVVGYAGLYAIAGSDADVQTVAVRPDSQGSGLGSRLVQELLAEAERRGCHRVFLEVAADNLGAQELYARHGFERISQRRNYYGQGVDGIVMRHGRTS